MKQGTLLETIEKQERATNELFGEIQELKKEVRELRSGRAQEVHVSDLTAERDILGFITLFREKGRKSVNILDLRQSLHLPVEQIDRIMMKLEKEGLVKEND